MSTTDDGSRRAPTMEDVAARAGVSRALVSIVFRGVPGASEDARARVLAAAEHLHYRPDQRARLLGRTRTRLLGVAFGLQHPFHADLVDAVYAAADALGYDVALSGVSPSRAEARAIEALLDYRCEALLLLGPGVLSRTLATLAQQRPVVVVARSVRGVGIDCVRTDDRDGARQATQHLIHLGHRRIAHIDGGSAPGAVERRRGYLAAMSAGGLSDQVHVLPGGLAEDSGAAAAARLLTENELPTGLTVFNDRSAVGALQTFRVAGKAIPEDVSLVGFDDDHLARLPYVDLTTIRQDAASLARHAVTRAVARLPEPMPPVPGSATPAGRRRTASIVVPPALIVRSTTAAPRR